MLVAALLLAVELAYSRGRKADQLVNAGSVASTATGRSSSPSAPFRRRTHRPLGLALVYVGDGCASRLLRGLATSRVPWGSICEFISLIPCRADGRRSGTPQAAIPARLWVFVLVPVLILLTVSGRWLFTNAADDALPPCRSAGLIHVSVVSLGSGYSWSGIVASILFC